MKQLLFIVLTVILINSCEKPKGDEECTWTKEIVNMNTGICKMKTQTSYENTYGSCIALDSLDSCVYNLLEIGMSFETIYLTQSHCSSPKDSIVGKIEDIIVICKNDYNTSYKKDDTLNSILKVIYTNPNGVNTTVPVLLNDYLQGNPICSNGISLFLTQSPDSTSLQSFKIIYKETDGTIYTDSTNIIYLEP